MEQEITVKVNPELNLGDLLNWLPIITQAVLVYPQLMAATSGQTVDSPVIPGVRIAHGEFDVKVEFTKK